MQVASGPQAGGSGSSFESDARRMAGLLRKHQYLVLLVLTLIYAVGVVGQARSKPLWYDEVVTLVAASAPSAAATWKAALGFDANPPLLHVLTHFSIGWFGTGEVAARLPAMLGFWIFCLCLYRFTLRRAGVYYAFLAMLLPVATEAYGYAYEARAYGIELAFSGLALVAWQMATEGSRRLLAVTLLAVSLAAAILCHYYAVLLYIPLASGELVRAWRARRVDWPVWMAFLLGGTPVVWRAATITHVVSAFSHPTWSPAYPEQVIEFWEEGLKHVLSFLVLGLAVGSAWLLRRSRGSGAAPAGQEAPPVLVEHELAAGAVFLAIPIFAVGAGLVVTHMFTDRYALPALAGVALLTPLILARLANGRALAGFVVAWLAFLPLAFLTVEIPPAHHPVADEPVLVSALEHGPVVVADGQLFLQMWHYLPERLKPNLLFVADDAAAVRYMGFDSMDVGLEALRPWCSARIVEFQAFATPSREFLLYQNPLKPGWLLAKLVSDGGSAEVLADTNYRQLFRARLKP